MYFHARLPPEDITIVYSAAPLGVSVFSMRKGGGGKNHPVIHSNMKRAISTLMINWNQKCY